LASGNVDLPPPVPPAPPHPTDAAIKPTRAMIFNRITLLLLAARALGVKLPATDTSSPSARTIRCAVDILSPVRDRTLI
jgi:hypothetical protein